MILRIPMDRTDWTDGKTVMRNGFTYPNGWKPKAQTMILSLQLIYNY